MFGVPKHANIISVGNTPTRYTKRHPAKAHLTLFTKRHTKSRVKSNDKSKYDEYQISCIGVARATKNYYQELNRAVVADQKAEKSLKRALASA